MKNIILFLIGAVLFGGLLMVVIAIKKDNQRAELKARSDYYQCKEKGYDVEFCFKTFKPMID